MSKGSDIGINSEAARKIQDAGSEFKLPGASREELRGMTREEWMEKYGDVLASEQFFQDKDPKWVEDQQSWWYKEVGRAGQDPPLWMKKQVRFPRPFTVLVLFVLIFMYLTILMMY